MRKFLNRKTRKFHELFCGIIYNFSMNETKMCTLLANGLSFRFSSVCTQFRLLRFQIGALHTHLQAFCITTRTQSNTIQKQNKVKKKKRRKYQFICIIIPKLFSLKTFPFELYVTIVQFYNRVYLLSSLLSSIVSCGVNCFFNICVCDSCFLFLISSALALIYFHHLFLALFGALKRTYRIFTS